MSLKIREINQLFAKGIVPDQFLIYPNDISETIMQIKQNAKQLEELTQEPILQPENNFNCDYDIDERKTTTNSNVSG